MSKREPRLGGLRSWWCAWRHRRRWWCVYADQSVPGYLAVFWQCPACRRRWLIVRGPEGSAERQISKAECEQLQ